MPLDYDPSVQTTTITGHEHKFSCHYANITWAGTDWPLECTEL
jgi:hypothetical protein